MFILLIIKYSGLLCPQRPPGPPEPLLCDLGGQGTDMNTKVTPHTELGAAVLCL